MTHWAKECCSVQLQSLNWVSRNHRTGQWEIYCTMTASTSGLPLQHHKEHRDTQVVIWKHLRTSCSGGRPWTPPRGQKRKQRSSLLWVRGGRQRWLHHQPPSLHQQCAAEGWAWPTQTPKRFKPRSHRAGTGSKFGPGVWLSTGSFFPPQKHHSVWTVPKTVQLWPPFYRAPIWSFFLTWCTQEVLKRKKKD